MSNAPKNAIYTENAPLLAAFNTSIDGSLIQWCTPSIHPAVPRVHGIYENDISVSYHSLGNPCTNTGIFFEAQRLAAQAYSSDHTLFCVNGSTGSNFIILRALKKQFGKLKILAQRNVHKSIGTACEDFQIDVEYISPRYHDELQIFLPNSIDEILAAIKQTKPQVLLISNPTYEGLSLNLTELVTTVREKWPNLILFIDEAWGAHFPFSEYLPTSAMQAGADICVQSTHKQGSGLQQTSMIHWKGKRISTSLLQESYTALTTTSPSYHLLASLDGARDFMQQHGPSVIDDSIQLSKQFRKKLNLVHGVTAYEPQELLRKARLAGCSAIQTDPTKILVHISGVSAFELAESLEKRHGIVVEKYESENILFIMKFQNGMREIDATVSALQTELKRMKEGKKQKSKKQISFPSFPTKIVKRIPAHKVGSIFESLELSKCHGRISAENIIPYPPGIPLIVKGEEISLEHIEYLQALKKTNGLITVISSDPNLETLKIVPKKGA